MKKFYRLWIFLLVWLCIFTLNFSNAKSPLRDKWEAHPTPTIQDPSINKGGINGKIGEWSTAETDKLHWILHFPERTDYSTNLSYALKLVQIFINWILWLLATVALIYMLYCWFLVFSSWSEDKNAQKGRKWISTAAIALAGIGLSWLIVSIMIWLINSFTGE